MKIFKNTEELVDWGDVDSIVKSATLVFVAGI